ASRRTPPWWRRSRRAGGWRSPVATGPPSRRPAAPAGGPTGRRFQARRGRGRSWTQRIDRPRGPPGPDAQGTDPVVVVVEPGCVVVVAPIRVVVVVVDPAGRG